MSNDSEYGLCDGEDENMVILNMKIGDGVVC